MPLGRFFQLLTVAFLVGGGYVVGRGWWEKKSAQGRLEEQAIWFARRLSDEAMADRKVDLRQSLDELPSIEWKEAGLHPENLEWSRPDPDKSPQDVVIVSLRSVDGRHMAVMRDRSVRWINLPRP